MKKSIYLKWPRKLVLVLVFVCVLFICGLAGADSPQAGFYYELETAEPIPVNSYISIRIYPEKDMLGCLYTIEFNDGGSWGGTLSSLEKKAGYYLGKIKVDDLADGTTSNLRINVEYTDRTTDSYEQEITFHSSGKLQPPEILTESDSFSVGTPVEIRISGSQNASAYSLSWIRSELGYENSIYISDVTYPYTVYTIDEQNFTADTYTICVTEYAEGWNTSDAATKVIQFSGTREEGPKVECNDAELFLSSSGSFTLTAQGATEFEYFFEGNDFGRVAAKNGSATLEIPTPQSDWGDGGEYELWVKAKINNTWTQYTKKTYEIKAAILDQKPHMQFFVNGSAWSYGPWSGDYAIIPENYVGSDGILAENGSFSVSLKNSVALWERYGTRPGWTVEQISGDPVIIQYEKSEANDGEYQYLSVTLGSTPQTAQDIQIRVTCDWNGHVSSDVFTMHFWDAEIPENVNIPDVIDMRVGVGYVIEPAFSTPLPWDAEKTRFDFESEYGFMEPYSFSGSMQPWTITPQKAGNVPASITIRSGNISAEKIVLIHIADAEGNYTEEVPDSVAISAEHFPDENFRNYICQQFDLDHNGILSSGELYRVKYIYVDYDSICSLEGIQYFFNLTELHCKGNQLRVLDLSNNTNLSFLYCQDNKLTTLTLGQNSALTELYCYGNQITLLDISEAPTLCTYMETNTRTAYDYGSYSGAYDYFGSYFKFDFFTTIQGQNSTSEPFAYASDATNERNPVFVDMPDTIALGQDIEFSFVASDDALQTVCYLYFMDGSAFKYLSNNWLSPYRQKVFRYGERFFDPGNYRLLLVSHLSDGETTYAIKDFQITGEVPEAPVASINKTEFYKDENAIFEIRPGKAGDEIESIMLYDGEYEDRIYGAVATQWGMKFTRQVGYSGEFAYSFRAKINGIWSAYSNPVSFTVISKGKLTVPEGLAVPEQLQAGEPLYFTVPVSDTINSYECTIERDDTYRNEYCYLYGNGTVLAHETGFDAASYTVRIIARGPGYDPSDEAVRHFTVTGTRPEAPKIIIPEGPHYNGDNIWVTFTAPGIEAVTQKYGNTFIGSKAGVQVSVYVPRWEEDWGFRAKINGRWTDEFSFAVEGEEREEIDTHLNVLSFPEAVQVGTDVPFRIELADDDSETYLISVAYVTDEGVSEEQFDDALDKIIYEMEFTPDENGNWSIPSMYLAQAGQYSIGLEAWGNRYRKFATKNLIVTETDNRPAAPDVTMLTEELKIYGDVQFAISAPGASKLCILVKEEEYASEVTIDPIVLTVEDANPYIFTFNSRNYDFQINDAFVLYVSAYRNGYWSEYSEKIHFQLEDTGYLLEDHYFDSEASPEGFVCIGDDVTLTWDSVPGAEAFGLSIDDGASIILPSTQTSYTFSSVGFDAGDHGVDIFAYATGKEPAYSFTRLVFVNNEWKPILQLSQNEINAGQTVTLTAQTFEGDYLNVFVDGEFYGVARRDSSGQQTISLNLKNAGIHTVQVQTSMYINNEEVSPMSDPAVITVLSDNEPDLILPANLTRIESEAFAGVRNVNIRIPSTVQEIAADAFDKSVTLLVPAGSDWVQWCVDHEYEYVEE